MSACRSGEACGARWSEIDETAALWTIPAERMKARTAQRVLLPPRCVAILAEARSLGSTSGHLFPSASGVRLSDMTLTKVLRDFELADEATVHGFRSAFKNWCAEVAKVVCVNFGR